MASTEQNLTATEGHPSAYNMADNHVTNGPVAEKAKEQAIKTENELSNLAASRTTQSQPAATGQQLTHYHSFFTSLLGWEYPRASAIAYISIILFIFGARYLDLLRYAFKLTWMTLGITVAAEVAGKALLSAGFTSQIRPRRYYVLPKETLDALIGDVHELVNFFIIESQRIIFAENVWASTAAFLGAFVSYFLIKIVPFWGLSLIETSVAFLVPLVYITNKELIDYHIKNVTDVMNQHTTQAKHLASHHAAIAAEATKQYASEYSAKAQEMIGVPRARSQSPADTTPLKTEKPNGTSNVLSTTPAYKESDFPPAPKEEFKASPIADTTTSEAHDKDDLLLAI